MKTVKLPLVTCGACTAKAESDSFTFERGCVVGLRKPDSWIKATIRIPMGLDLENIYPGEYGISLCPDCACRLVGQGSKVWG